MSDNCYLQAEKRHYHALIGTGGVGAGTLFALDGNETLGREESRGGRFLPHRDYCKLHIITHYVQTLLGPDITVMPAGRVGDDETGQRLYREMQAVGLDLSAFETVPGETTLNCICLVYPDHSGGNLTVTDSASARVSPAFIRRTEPQFARFSGNGIALAVPEVPLDARRELLKLGTQYNFFRVASFVSGEMDNVRASAILAQVDLLALNLDEATALVDTEEKDEARILQQTLAYARSINPQILLSVTLGSRGSRVFGPEINDERPILHVPVQSTAGAGDAHLSGLLAGLTLGLPLPDAHQLAQLTAAVSVTSCHTINDQLDTAAIRDLARSQNLALSPALCQALRLKMPKS